MEPILLKKREYARYKLEGNNNWIPKRENSTFFPSSWSNDRILEEIAYVRSKATNQVPQRKWTGLSSDGILTIEVRYTGGDINNLTFDSAFPI